MWPHIDDETVAAFHTDGAICLQAAIDEHTVQDLAAAIEDDIANPGPY